MNAQLNSAPFRETLKVTLKVSHNLYASTLPLLVAVTGYGQPEDRKRALAAGFDVHLTKPVNIDELAQLLNFSGVQHE